MNKGKYVFSQIMTYFPRWVFEDSVKKYKGDFHAKNLNSYSHCLHLMFGQLAGCKSLKDITLVRCISTKPISLQGQRRQ